MRNIITITKKEFASYFNSPIAYIFSGVFIVLTNWFFWSDFFIINQATMRGFFNLLPWVFLLLIPAITMRLWSEEKRSGTIEHLLTLPIKDFEAVLGKFFSSLAFLTLTLTLTLPIPLSISKLGNIDKGTILGGYLGAFLLAATYMSLGLFISSVTKNQIASYIMSAASAFLLYILGSDFILNQTSEPITSVFNFLGFAPHYENIIRGVLDSRDIIYFVLLTAFFLFLNTKSVEKRDIIKRSKYHANIAFQIIIFLAILVTANYTGSLKPLRVDLTDNKVYSLTGTTKKLLTSLDDIVTIKAYLSTDLPPRFLNVKQEINDTLEEYKALSNGNVTFKVIDPKEKQEYEDEARSLGIPVLQFSDIEFGEGKFQISNGYLGLAVFYEDKKEIIPIVENTRNLEHDLTLAIKRVTSDETHTVAFTSGQDELDRDTELRNVWQLLQKQYNVQTLNLSTLEEVPEDIDTVIIAGPKKSFSQEELYVLDQILMKGKSLFFLLDGVQVSQGLQAVPSDLGLEELLNHYGAKLNKDLVLDISNEWESFRTGFTIINTQYPFLVKIRKEGFDRDNVIVNRLESLVLPWVSSVEKVEERAEGKEIINLITTSDKSWTQSENFNLDPNQKFDIKDDQVSSKTVGLLLNGVFTSFFENKEIPEKFTSQELLKQTDNARIVLVGDSEFITDNRLARFQSNLVFFLNAVDFLTQDADLISIRAKATTDRPLRLDITDRERSIYKYLDMFGPVFLVLLIGSVRSSYRKRRTVNLNK